MIMAQLMWSVLPVFATVLEGASAVMKEGGDLWILQHFYQPGEQQYGKEFIQKPEDCLALVKQAGFSVSRTVEANRFTNHKLIVCAQKPSGHADR